jgi:flagellar biogenesis protein FliO
MNRVGNGNLETAVGRIITALTACAARLQQGFKRRRSERRLRLSETLSLGEKRFLAVVQFQHQEFLVGGTGSSIALLAKLDAPQVTPDSREASHELGS